MIQTMQTNQITQLDETQLKDWYLGAPSTELRNLSMEDLNYVLENVTPYEPNPAYSKNMVIKLIEQWIEHEETWEEFPVSRREMFRTYKNLNGTLPKLEMPTLRLFTYFISIGVLH